MSSTPRKKKTFLLVLGSLGLLLACAAVGYYFYTIWAADKELREAIAEVDRLDPGWRLEELEANREVIPDAENGALKVLAAKKLMPAGWWPSFLQSGKETDAQNGVPVPDQESSSAVDEQLQNLSPEVRLSQELAQALRTGLQKADSALAEARSLVNFPKGRYQVKWSLDYIFTRLPCQDARTVANLLWYDALLRAEEGDIDQAVVSDLAMINAGRSVGDEPCLISQLVRLGTENYAIATLERVLAQGQASEKSLRNLQRNFEDEMSRPLFLFGARGERAGHHRMIEAIETGKIKVSSMTSVMQSAPPAGVEAWWENVSGEWEFRRSHAPWLRIMTEIVEIAKLPVEQHRSELKGYAESIDRDRRIPVYVRLVVPSITKVAESVARNQAFFRCAVVALAAERYRLAHNRWPESLDQLLPEYLHEVPLDPYDSKPLRYRRLADGVVIYSIGPDEKDDGGKLDRQNPTAAGTDLGFQLWDVNRRRQPWRPPPKAPDEDDK